MFALMGYEVSGMWSNYCVLRHAVLNLFPSDSFQENLKVTQTITFRINQWYFLVYRVERVGRRFVLRCKNIVRAEQLVDVETKSRAV